MTEFRKYKMNSTQDYRPNIEKHEVRLVRVIDGQDWKYDRFSIIDEDMIDMTEEEFVAKYQEIIDKQEFARNEIVRLEQ